MRTEAQRELQRRPRGLPRLRQRWEHLLFLHWSFEPEAVEATLPPGLSADTFDGRAWVGIVPFRMRGVRPAGTPPLPGLSAFRECNVRTYVLGPDGRPGVYFHSLDADQKLAVEVARRAFKLNYFRARMSASVEGDWVRYRAGRTDPRGPSPNAPSNFLYRGERDAAEAEPGSLDFFCLERYLLYAWESARERLFAGRIWHPPYRAETADVASWDARLAQSAGFALEDAATPEHQRYVREADVRVFGLERVS